MKAFLTLVAVAAAGVAAAQDMPPPPPPGPPSAPPPAYAPPNPPPAPPYEEGPSSQVPVGSVAMPPGFGPEDARDAVLWALGHRGWHVVGEGPGYVTAHLLHHHVDAVLTVRYDAGHADFLSSAYWVGHRADQRIAPAVPRTWVRYLESDIAHYARRR
jgi:hypothetical protein